MPGHLTFQPGTLEDGRMIADVRTAEFPDEPWDPPSTISWYAEPDQVWSRFRCLAGEEVVGFAAAHHNPWSVADDGFVWLVLGFFPAHRTGANLAAAIAFLEGQARGESGRTSITNAREDDTVLLAVLDELGYAEERRDRYWELDLIGRRASLLEMAERSRERMRRQGITLTTLAADADPEKYRKLHAVSSEGELDVPTTATNVPPSLERLMEMLDEPSTHKDRVWIARIGEDLAGLSMLGFPVERGIVATDWTAVARAHRNRGIARALKLETVVQAIELGVERVRTDNDSTNSPILRLNEELGYRRVFDRLALTRSLESTSQP